MGKRSRQRGRTDSPTAPTTDYPGPDGTVLVMRGALSPATRRRYADTFAGGLDREDARARGIELLFEHLAVSWTIAGVTTERQKDLLGRYRMASASERDFVLATLRAHLTENFPEMEAP
jgi:hypothetical protein